MAFPEEFPILKTKRLLLREITVEDWKPMIEIAGFKIDQPTKEDAIKLIEQNHEIFEKRNGLTWGLDLNGEIIGTVGYYRGFERSTGEIGYVMCESYKRQGYMSEAISAAMQFGFETLQLKCITAYTKISKVPSVLLLEKLRFRDTQENFKEYRIFDILPGALKSD